MSTYDRPDDQNFNGDYTAAVAEISSIQAREISQSGFNPELKTIVMSHGKRTHRVVLWFHGYTSAPRQFENLGKACFARGLNVFIPCVPHHGFKDRLSPEVSRLNAVELSKFSNRMVDIACGLGDEIIVGGLSMGGAMAAWIAQNRDDVSSTLIVAPFLGARMIPTRLTRLVAFGAGVLPDHKLWLDPQKKLDLDGPKYGYPQFSTRSLAQILKLAFETADSARKMPPYSRRIRMILNAHDESVNNLLADRLVESWHHWSGVDVESYTFPDALGIPHDCISVEQPKGQPDLVYTKILEMI